MLTIRTDYEKILSNILKTVRQYLEKNGHLSSLVIGLSGGIDSALTCALAHEALKEVTGVKLIGRSIPIETNTKQEMARAEYIGKNFCDQFEIKDLTKAYRAFYKALVGSGREKKETINEKIRQGNVKARIRMTYLFDLAHFEKGMVLSTDNYTELLLGFWTLHGDVGNYGFLQYLWKTEVYGLAKHMLENYRSQQDNEKADALQACIDAVPTDGLGITGSDFDQIGVPDYETADRLLISYLEGDTKKSDHPAIKRHKNSAFKRVDPQNISRKTLFQ
jgi:NAD+ synthase